MEIRTFSPTSHKIKAVIYGAAGSGKTRFASTAPKAIFASAEAGLLSTLKNETPVRYVEIKRMEDLRELLQYLQKPGHGFETVVIDSISEINEIIKEGIEKKRGAQMQLKDWNDLSKAIKGILRGFRDLDMHVIFIAQEKVEKDDQKTEKIVPMLNGKAAIEIAYFNDIVGYLFIDKLGEHKMTTQPNEKLLTKCRGIELPGDAPLDFKEWIKVMNEIVLKPEETTIIETPKKVTPPPAKAPANATQRIQAATSKEMYAQWNKYYESTGGDPKQAVAVLTATLKKEFGKESSRELTEVEALKFVERLRAANKKRIEEAKALDIDKDGKDLTPAIGKEIETPSSPAEVKPILGAPGTPPTLDPGKVNVEVAKDDLKPETQQATIQA